MFNRFGLVGVFHGNGFSAVPNVHAGAHFHPTPADIYSNNSPNTHS